MLRNVPNHVKKIYIETGNMLNMNEIMKKVGQTPTEELLESLKIVLKDYVPPTNFRESLLHINPSKMKSEQQNSIEIEDRKGLKMTLKVFLTSASQDMLLEAINIAFSTLDTDVIDSVVLACASPGENGEVSVSCLQEVWCALEELVNNGKIRSIGLCDLDTQLFISLYNWAKVKPSIIQINLASCCVVPPALQEFTKQNDVQLLTHSDPSDILPKSVLEQVIDQEVLCDLQWLLRYQVHVKCRGVLASKGYVVCCQRSSKPNSVNSH